MPEAGLPEALVPNPETPGANVTSVTRFLEDKLHLRVNRLKSAVAHVSERKFLGHRLLSGGRLGIAPQSLKRARERL